MDATQERVPCESCGGAGKVLIEISNGKSYPGGEDCPNCQGSGKRSLNMGDLREAGDWGINWLGNIIDEVRLKSEFNQWLLARYGKGE